MRHFLRTLGLLGICLAQTACLKIEGLGELTDAYGQSENCSTEEQPTDENATYYGFGGGPPQGGPGHGGPPQGGPGQCSASALNRGKNRFHQEPDECRVVLRKLRDTDPSQFDLTSELITSTNADCQDRLSGLKQAAENANETCESYLSLKESGEREIPFFGDLRGLLERALDGNSDALEVFCQNDDDGDDEEEEDSCGDDEVVFDETTADKCVDATIAIEPFLPDHSF